MLIPNTLFRMGGAAMILTNRITEYARAKYELQHVVRVHLGADDMAYECVPVGRLPWLFYLHGGMKCLSDRAYQTVWMAGFLATACLEATIGHFEGLLSR